MDINSTLFEDIDVITKIIIYKKSKWLLAEEWWIRASRNCYFLKNKTFDLLNCAHLYFSKKKLKLKLKFLGEEIERGNE